MHRSIRLYIFMDIETIRDGEDFVDAIERAVAECDTVLVVIGPNWLMVNPQTGEKRIFEEDDFVRLEIALALKADHLVIPVLVGDAEMPRPEDLPLDLQTLWRRNARRLTDDHWEYDVEALVNAVVVAEAQ